MRLSIATIIIFSFLGVAVLGAMFMMPHDNYSEEVACIASLAKGSVCPKGDITASVMFHVNAFKNFSTAILGSSLMFLFACITFLIFTAIVALKSFVATKAVSTFHTRYRHLFELISIPPKQEFTYWFSLHENSPTTA